MIKHLPIFCRVDFLQDRPKKTPSSVKKKNQQNSILLGGRENVSNQKLEPKQRAESNATARASLRSLSLETLQLSDLGSRPSKFQVLYL